MYAQLAVVVFLDADLADGAGLGLGGGRGRGGAAAHARHQTEHRRGVGQRRRVALTNLHCQ